LNPPAVEAGGILRSHFAGRQTEMACSALVLLGSPLVDYQVSVRFSFQGPRQRLLASSFDLAVSALGPRTLCLPRRLVNFFLEVVSLFFRFPQFRFFCSSLNRRTAPERSYLRETIYLFGSGFVQGRGRYLLRSGGSITFSCCRRFFLNPFSEVLFEGLLESFSRSRGPA